MKISKKTCLFLLGLAALTAPRLATAANCAVTLGTDTGVAGELRDCIDNVATTAGDVVTIPSGLTVSLTAGQITVDQSISIQGAGDGSSIIDGTGNVGRIFEIDDPTTPLGVAVTISGLTLQNASDTDGGAIYINPSGSLTINNSLLTMNHAEDTGSGDGGAIYVFSGSLLINNSRFILNDADYQGGAIYNDGGTLRIFNDSLFDQNSAADYGGGIYSIYSVAEIIDTVFTRNSTASYGGAICNDEGSMTLNNCVIGGPAASDGNTTVSGYGAGLCNYYGNMIVENSTISNNVDTGGGDDGGGIYSGYGFLMVNNSTVSNNSAGYGAGIYSMYGGASITNSTIEGNTAPNSSEVGGGIYCEDYDGMTISNTTISNNNADYGGGIYNNYCSIVINNSTLSNNHATDIGSDGDGLGGGIYSEGYYGGFIITNSTLNGNTAVADGGGIYSDESTLDLRNTTLFGNTANGSGGGIFSDDSYAINLNNVTIANNTADGDGAGGGDGGGIFNDSNSGTNSHEFSFSNTIIANNTDSGAGPDCFNDFASGDDTLTSRGNNLIGDPTGCQVTGDLTGNLNGDPGLAAALANNGGPTLTLALLSGSQAIGAGNNALCEPTDQRGTVRPQGTNCDLGAFEAGPSADLSATSVTFSEQAVGTTSAPQIVTLTNNGTIALEINSITITGLDLGDFAQTNDCGSSLAVGASCDISITVTPTVAGVRQASVTLDTQASIQLIALLASGFTPGGGCSLHLGSAAPVGLGGLFAWAMLGFSLVGAYRVRCLRKAVK